MQHSPETGWGTHDGGVFCACSQHCIGGGKYTYITFLVFRRVLCVAEP